MNVIRTIIVDDEPIARRGLVSFLKTRADIQLVAECRNGREAVTAIRRDCPDLVLLDVQMPGLGGLGVVRAIGAAEMPCVVFITAYDQFAVRAFEVAAVDYVVKPYTVARLSLAIDRALGRLREQRVTLAHEHLLQALGDGPTIGQTSVQTKARASRAPYAERLIVSVGARSAIVPLEDVTVLRADGYHVVVHTANDRYLLRESLQTLEERLDPAEFKRVHRSTIVRVAAVRSVERSKPDQLYLQMTDGTRIPVSRSRRASVMKGLNGIHG
jgi:two-component system LytT family response regulator